MTAVCRSKVRNGVDADSAAAGDLQPGDRLTVLELGRNKAGQLRVRHAQGWSSFATAGSGRQLLRLQTLEAPGGGSGSAAAAAAVGLKRPAAADKAGGPSKRAHTAGAVSALAALRRREDQRREEPWGEEQRREEQRRNEQRQEVRRREAQRREAQWQEEQGREKQWREEQWREKQWREEQWRGEQWWNWDRGWETGGRTTEAGGRTAETGKRRTEACDRTETGGRRFVAAAAAIVRATSVAATVPSLDVFAIF